MGEIYSSDQDCFHYKWFDHYLEMLHCSKMDASDNVEVCGNKRTRRNGVEYWPERLPNPQALRRRYVRTAREFRDGLRRSQFIVIDLDKPFGHEDWIGKLPQPHFVVINPVSAKCHLLYVLDTMYVTSGDMFRKVSAHMASIIGADKANPVSFRSPFFIKGRRERHESFRKGFRESDYHYVIHHEHGAYSIRELSDCFPSIQFKGHERTQQDVLYPDIGILQKKAHSAGCAGAHRNERLFQEVSDFAYSNGPSVTIEELISFAHDRNVGGLNQSEVNSIAKSVFNFMQTRFTGTKKTKENLSQRGTFAVGCRWEYHNRLLGETLVEAATRFGVHYNTTMLWKRVGKIKLVNRKWQLIGDETLRDAAKRFGKSYATVKRWRAAGKIPCFNGQWRLENEVVIEPYDYQSVDRYSCDYDPDMREQQLSQNALHVIPAGIRSQEAEEAPEATIEEKGQIRWRRKFAS